MTHKRALHQRLAYRLIRVVTRVVAVLFFRFRVSGRENFPETGGGLICSNHQSHLDPVLVGLTCDRPFNFLARKTLFKFAPFRWLILFLDSIPIDRDGMGIGGIKETLRRLKRGEFVLIFPEGTRTSDGEVAPLKPGFLALARRGKSPLVPVAFDGAFQAWPKGRNYPMPGKIGLVIGKPITQEEICSMSDEELLKELESRIHLCFQKARKYRS